VIESEGLYEVIVAPPPQYRHVFEIHPVTHS